MADIMRTATPINNRNIIQPTKEHRDASALPFDFQDASKIKSTMTQSEMLGQNNVMRENGSSSATVMYSMLKDPEAAATFLKNIFFLREIVGLMPLNNETHTEEMQQLLNRLILTPEEIPAEMQRQENIATIFKGELFDTLRKLLFQNGKSVGETISEKFSMIPLAQLKEENEGRLLNRSDPNLQTGQTNGTESQQTAQMQNTQNMQNVQVTQNSQNVSEEQNVVLSQTDGVAAEVQTQQQTEPSDAWVFEGLMNPQPSQNPSEAQNPQQTPQSNVPEQQNGQQISNQQPSVLSDGAALTQETSLPTEVNFKNPTEGLPVQNGQPAVQTAENGAEVSLSQSLKAAAARSEGGINPEKAVSQQEIHDGVLNLLKAINSQQNRTDVLDAVKNNLSYIKSVFPESSDYSHQISHVLKSLEAFISSPQTREGFNAVKSQTLELLEGLQNSVLYDEEMSRISALAKYNLSRYNSSEDIVTEAFLRLLESIPDKQTKLRLGDELVRYFENGGASHGAEESKTMSALAEILEKQSENTEAKMLNPDSVDKIVHGLLSSPSNFTPLLHYVIPVDNKQVQAMAEIWINPNGDEDVEGGASGGKKMTHMLVVFEIDGIGKFETELYAEDKSITLSVLCPPEHVDSFRGVNSDIRRACESTGYRFKSIEIGELKETRSLMDVFRSLPARRSGINVTI